MTLDSPRLHQADLHHGVTAGRDGGGRHTVDRVASSFLAVGPRTFAFTYDPRGSRSSLTKPNGNVATTGYHQDGLVRTMVEKTSADKGSLLVSSHSLKYHLDGDRREDVEKLDEAGTTGVLDQTSTYAYTPALKLKSVVKTGADKGEDESYVYDAAGNTTSQTIGAVKTAMTYDRNRLTKRVFGTTTVNHRYDAFGRSATMDVGAQVVLRSSYDGYDRMVRSQKWDTAGVHQGTKTTSFDPFDRTTTSSVQVTTQPAVTSRFGYLGLADQIAVEEQTNTAGTFEVAKVFSYGPGGEKLSLVDTPVNATTTKKFFYGTNPHGDVESLTDATTGATTSTYRYNAYGLADKKGTTGDDAITGDPVKDVDLVNLPHAPTTPRFCLLLRAPLRRSRGSDVTRPRFPSEDRSPLHRRRMLRFRGSWLPQRQEATSVRRSRSSAVNGIYRRREGLARAPGVGHSGLVAGPIKGACEQGQEPSSTRRIRTSKDSKRQGAPSFSRMSSRTLAASAWPFISFMT